MLKLENALVLLEALLESTHQTLITKELWQTISFTSTFLAKTPTSITDKSHNKRFRAQGGPLAEKKASTSKRDPLSHSMIYLSALH